MALELPAGEALFERNVFAETLGFVFCTIGLVQSYFLSGFCPVSYVWIFFKAEN
jgi:hypothetical protein